MRSRRLFAVALLLAGGGGLRSQTLAPGFTDTLVARVSAPTAIAFLPDGRILVTTQSGAVRLIQNDQLRPEPVFTIPSGSICSNSERGLLGVAVDPQFEQNGFVYLFYTYRGPGRDCTARSPTIPVNRVSRFVMNAASGRIDPISETVLIDNVSSYAGNHNAGDVKFGRDGNLLVTTGDGGCHYGGGNRCAGGNDAARERHTLLAKVLRIDRDGNIPSDNNLHQTGVRCNQGNAQPGQICLEAWAWGLRNPFRIAIDPHTGGVIANDVGQGAWEEIDEIVPGSDYGWNEREGFCATGSTTGCSTGEMFGSFRNPIYAYRHNVQVPGTDSSVCNSISGGTFIPNNTWNAGLEGFYFADFVCGSIFQLLRPASGAPTAVRELGRGFGSSSLISLEIGPFRNTKAMYYTTYARGGEVRRIVGFAAASAASYVRSFLAPDSLASLFGASLDGATLSIRDSASIERTVDVSFSSETQMNFLVPAATSLGRASLIVRRGGTTIATTTAEIERTRPGIFALDGSGTGTAAATALKATFGAVQPVPVFLCSGGGTCTATPIDVAQGDIYLTLYATGVRGAASVAVTAGSISLDVQYAGPQGQYPGLDQINVRLPASLAGRGEVSLVVNTETASLPVTILVR